MCEGKIVKKIYDAGFHYTKNGRKRRVKIRVFEDDTYDIINEISLMTPEELNDYVAKRNFIDDLKCLGLAVLTTVAIVIAIVVISQIFM